MSLLFQGWVVGGMGGVAEWRIKLKTTSEGLDYLKNEDNIKNGDSLKN